MDIIFQHDADLRRLRFQSLSVHQARQDIELEWGLRAYVSNFIGLFFGLLFGLSPASLTQSDMCVAG